MNKTVLILPFYGRLPWYFNFYLKSLENVKCDVLFVSDLTVDVHPLNFRHLDMSMEEMASLASRKTGLPVVFANAYKLCDFKPMYGKIFEDYIKGYEYWAFGDCDLVYGNTLNSVLDDIASAHYDIASFRKMWLSGGFCMMRNVESVNTLFRGVSRLAEMSSCSRYCFFDEIGGNWFDDLENGRITIEDCASRADSFSALVWRTDGLKFFHEDLMCEDSLRYGCVSMQKGNLEFDGVSVPIFHYIKAKHLGRFVGEERSYDTIENYRITWRGHFCGEMEWRYRNFIGFRRNVSLHVRAYENLLHHRGWRGLVSHLFSRLQRKRAVR